MSLDDWLADVSLGSVDAVLKDGGNKPAVYDAVVDNFSRLLEEQVAWAIDQEKPSDALISVWWRLFNTTGFIVAQARIDEDLWTRGEVEGLVKSLVPRLSERAISRAMYEADREDTGVRQGDLCENQPWSGYTAPWFEVDDGD